MGTVAPPVAHLVEAALWPVLGMLLYTTFTQVPVTHLSDAFRDSRFIVAALAGNFVFVQLVVWGLVSLLPPDQSAIRLGVLLVLLVPLHRAGSSPSRISSSAIYAGQSRSRLSICWCNRLPLCLRLFIGEAFIEIFAVSRIAVVFVTLIGLPLLAAFATERWPGRDMVISRLGIVVGKHSRVSQSGIRSWGRKR